MVLRTPAGLSNFASGNPTVTDDMGVRRRKILTWKRFHKWIGLVLAVFFLLFCISGLVLNHRAFFAPWSVSRALLPGSYHIRNYNNGIIKGTVPLSDGRLLAYGSAGVWLTDRKFSRFSDFNNGLPAGSDRRSIRSIVRAGDGTLWCAAQFGLYRFENGRWRETELPGRAAGERVTDVTAGGDDGRVVALTRSAVYVQQGRRFVRTVPGAPAGYSRQMSLFKTVWNLHSGGLFGQAGRVVVDLIAVVIIFLCVTGIVLFVLPFRIRRAAAPKSGVRLFKWNFRWHDRVGYYALIPAVLLAVTGTCLRPPLMIPFVLMKTAPVPGSVFDGENVWYDKFRAIRWDGRSGHWLISTSEGFVRVEKDFGGRPEPIDAKTAPPVSPMGVNVFEPAGAGRWLVGSFGGLYVWNPEEGSVLDYFSGKPARSGKGGRPVSDCLVAGFTGDSDYGPVVFDYAKGAGIPAAMPALLAGQPISLWNVALELHVGRCYAPFLGPLSELFVFISGTLLTLVLISGLVIHNRHDRKQK